MVGPTSETYLFNKIQTKIYIYIYRDYLYKRELRLPASSPSFVSRQRERYYLHYYIREREYIY